MKCSRCGTPSRWAECDECRGEARARTVPPVRNDRLPPPLPEPIGIPFCKCGAITGLVTFQGVSRCAECWRSGR